ncbi:MAG: sugar phosphate isomerase/epimerase [Saprospiraceae bacterium]|nr:sugar phosphate isomerase/epimerase [Saprospiraceae bacterium]
MERRKFIALGGTATLGFLSMPIWAEELGPENVLSNIGLQLYTLRDAMNENPVGTLKAVKAIGYSHVECAGYSNGLFYGQPKENFKGLLASIDLKMYSGHTNTGFGKPPGTISMTHNWERYCEDAAFMEQKYIVSAYFEPNERKTIDDYKKHAALFNTCAELAKKYNLIFCHHNHDFEFVPINGIVPYDILLKETDKNLVKFELDHYWTTKAKVNTKKLFKKNPGRFPLFHIKDMDNTIDRSFTEVGSGVIDWVKIFRNAKLAGLDLFYVEQDICKNMAPLKSIEVSYNFLKDFKY